MRDLGKKKIQINRFLKKLEEISNYKTPKVNIELTDSIYTFQEIRIEFDEVVNEKISSLAVEYEDKINHTCPKCGKIENYDSLCDKCQYKWYRKITIRQNKISKNGFKIYKTLGIKRFDKHYRYTFIKWDDLSRVAIDNTYELGIVFTLKSKDFQDVNVSFTYFMFQENFFYLLKNIPEYLFTAESLNYRNKLLDLVCCGVCGYISKNENYKCFVCDTNGLWKNENLTERQIQRNETLSSINTKLKLDFINKLKTKNRYPKRENEFAKCIKS